MSVQKRNNVQVQGDGPATMFLAHGFGCDQNMWRLLQPAYAGRFRTVLFDLVGSGASDLSAYDPGKYSTLQGYADDVIEIVQEFGRWNAMLYAPNMLPQYEFVGRGTPPKSLAGFKGMRVRALGGLGEAMRNMGAVPTSVPVSPDCT